MHGAPHTEADDGRAGGSVMESDFVSPISRALAKPREHLSLD